MTASIGPVQAPDDQHHRFYIAVYTETDAHVNRYICGGGLDLGLNETGMAQAVEIAARFKRNPLKVKQLIGSPELRAIQMADIFHDQIKVKLSLWREFADQFMGEWEGAPIDPNMDFKNPPQGETEEAFFARIRIGLEKMIQQKDLVFLVTHYRVAKAICRFFELKTDRIQPGKVYEVGVPSEERVASLKEIWTAPPFVCKFTIAIENHYQ